MTTDQMRERIEAYVSARAKHEEAKAAEQESALALNDANERVVEAFEQMGVTSLKLPGIGSVGVSHRQFVSANGERREELFRFLREQGYADLVKEQVHSQSLTSVVNEMERDGNPLRQEIDPLISTYTKYIVTVRRT